MHVTLAGEMRPTQVIYSEEGRACDYAADLSTDDGVLASNVVRFFLDEIGTRSNIAMFVHGHGRNYHISATAGQFMAAVANAADRR